VRQGREVAARGRECGHGGAMLRCAPSPHGDLRVVILRILVGRRTGPLTLRRLSLAPLIRSPQTFSRFFTLRDVRVMRMRCTLDALASSSICLVFSAAACTRAKSRDGEREKG
jgi:hypothetical protein